MANRILDLPLEERPRERCLREGTAALSLRECLALLMGVGSKSKGCLALADQILEQTGASFFVTPVTPPTAKTVEAHQAFFESLEAYHRSSAIAVRLSPTQKTRLLATFELARRYVMFRERKSKPRPALWPRPSFQAQVTGRVPAPLLHATTEWLGFIPIYRGEAGELCVLEKGVRTHVNFEPAELFARVLVLRPQGFVLCHNHPSGDPTPSEQDHQLTQRVAAVARALGLHLYGHAILTPRQTYWVEAPVSELCQNALFI